MNAVRTFASVLTTNCFIYFVEAEYFDWEFGVEGKGLVVSILHC